MKKGKIFIMSGPSGSGKTTLYKKILCSRKLKDKLEKSISVTTRSKRVGEQQGRDYFFVSRRMFFYKKQAGQFLECQKVFDNYYGTPRKHVRDILQRGKSVLLCIDVKGARVVFKKIPQAIRIFIKVPSLAVLRRRLEKRGSETKTTGRLRLKTALDELKEAKFYDYVVVNDRLEKTYKKIEKTILAELKKG